MTDELDGKQPEAGSEQSDKPVEGTAPQGATYDGPIEKFKGKTAAEIAQSYGDLESAFGKKDMEFKSQGEKLQGYEQYYQTQQAQQQQAPPAPPTPPADIYDNPQAFVTQAAQPLVEKAVEQAKFQSALQIAPIMKNQAKQNFPEIFDGVDEKQLENIMYNGVKTGTVHYSALADENAWKMAAWQMKGDSTGYKPTGPQPTNPTQTEQPSGGSHESEPMSMPREAQEWAAAMGKDSNEARKIWEATQKAKEKK